METGAYYGMKDCYLIGTGDDAWELAFLLILAFDDCFDDAGMVGAKVHEAVGYARLIT